ncbi:MAG TPA: hypothetical protein VNJ71_11670 [Gemmatimonadales bacterium]|jgi:hypothetical protein|nr:hypothetical protein [Gemmatimonadales bacterium]
MTISRFCARLGLAAGLLLAFLTPVFAEKQTCELAAMGTWTIIISPQGSGLACYGNPYNCCRS